MTKFRHFSKRIFCIILAVILMCSGNIVAFASANSESSNVDDPDVKNYRAFLEGFVESSSGSGYYGGVLRQNIMHTYLKKGETVYFGCNTYDSLIDINGLTYKDVKSSPTGCDIVVKNPDGTKTAFDVEKDGVGYIDSRNKTLAGPQIKPSDAGDTSKYIPLSFTAQVSGIYDFNFRSKDGKVATPSSRGARVTNDDANALANASTGNLVFWDITIADADYNLISGRTYSDYLALSTANADYLYQGVYYVVTKDGYIYKVSLHDFQPFGFILFSNNQGITDIGKTPSSIYHSVYDNDNNCLNLEKEELITFHHPNAPDTDIARTNMIFYEQPNKDLIGILFDEPVEPTEIDTVNFIGAKENKTFYTMGGRFEFECHGATSVTLVIDFNVSINDSLKELQDKLDAGKKLTQKEQRIYNSIQLYRKSKGSGIVEINGATVDGKNVFQWNGLDNTDNHMPIGIFNSKEMNITTEPKAGEIHFPFLDVEGIYKGLEIERINGAGGRDSKNPKADRFDLYYNNSPLAFNTIEGKAGNPTDPSEGANLVGSYYHLSDGTLSYKPGSNQGLKYFKNGFKGTNGYTYTNDEDRNISTLILNPDYVAPEDETVDDLQHEAQTKYIHVPVNSHETSMKFGESGSTSGFGGGDRSVIDAWTYFGGKHSTSVKFDADFEIAPNDTVGELSGRVFYDDYYKGTRGTYNQLDGDYVLPNVLVTLVDANGNQLPVLDESGEPVYDDKGNPQYYYATTDLQGFYKFVGVYYGGEDHSKTFYVKTLLTEAQEKLYTECTTNNDFNLAKKSPIKQNKTLTYAKPIGEFGDIGYTSNLKTLSELTVSKVWENVYEQRPDNIKVELYMQMDDEDDVLIGSNYLSAANGWKYTYYNLNKLEKYYVKEYIEDSAGYETLIGQSVARSINEEEFDSVITESVTETNASTHYSVNFTFNPNIVGPTIQITNKEIEPEYKVVFHTNYFGTSDENEISDIYRTYRRSKAVQDGEYALNDNTWTIDAFYDIPERNNYVFAGWYYEPDFNDNTKVLKWSTDDYSGDNDEDNDGDKYTMTNNNVYHIYAHWIPVGTVTKDTSDEKLNTDSYYSGFGLIGVQIRNYRLDPNYDDGDTFYHYKKEIQGLRFISSIRNGLLKSVNDVYDVDAGQEFYDYEGTKTYSKLPSYQNINYGYVNAAESNWTKFYNNYNGKNGYVYDQLKYLGTNVNGEKTSSKYKYAQNIECTSAVGPNYVDDDNIDKENAYHPSTSILDHRNYNDYRIMSMVVTYNELTDSTNMANKTIARPYLKYVDSNGLERVFYANYQGTSAIGKGCAVSYNDAYNEIKDKLELVYLGKLDISRNR